jgi:hypothetical protein
MSSHATIAQASRPRIRRSDARRAARGRTDHSSDGIARSKNYPEASQKSDRRYDRALPATRGKNERVLVTTLTKRTAEDLADYLI